MTRRSPRRVTNEQASKDPKTLRDPNAPRKARSAAAQRLGRRSAATRRLS